MSDDQPADLKPTATTRQPDGRWLPGATGNPKGRPRKGSSLAEAIRAKVDPAALVEIALAIAQDKASPALQLQALQFLAGAGFVKPEQRHEVLVGAAGDDEPEDLSHLTTEQLRALQANERERAAILARSIPLELPGSADSSGGSGGTP